MGRHNRSTVISRGQMLVMCTHKKMTQTRKITQCIGKLQYVISMHVR